MAYYIIKDTECKLYKQLKQMREGELARDEEYRQKIKEAAGFDIDFDTFVKDDGGTQGFCRCFTYSALAPKDKKFVPDAKVWREDKTYKGFYQPNRRCKKGRELYDLMQNGHTMPYCCWDLYGIFGLDAHGRYAIPMMDFRHNIVFIWFDDKFRLERKKGVIEVTRTVWNVLFFGKNKTNN